MHSIELDTGPEITSFSQSPIATSCANAIASPIPLARWSPSRRPPRHIVRPIPQSLKLDNRLDGSKDPATWTLVSITAAEDLGHVRSGMTYNKDYGTSAGFFEKPRRIQFLEGPNEPAVADHLEMNPRYLDFQFQPLDLTFRRADGMLIHKYPDVGIEFDDNTVCFGEIKSNEAWFHASGIRRPLDRVEQALQARGLGPLLRIQGEPFMHDHVIEAHRAAIDARLTCYDPHGDVQTVCSAIDAQGGTASFGTLVAALGGTRSHAEAKLHAMMLRRVVAFELSSRPTTETPVTCPKPARPYALRAMLAQLKAATP